MGCSPSPFFEGVITWLTDLPEIGKSLLIKIFQMFLLTTKNDRNKVIKCF